MSDYEANEVVSIITFNYHSLSLLSIHVLRKIVKDCDSLVAYLLFYNFLMYASFRPTGKPVSSLFASLPLHSCLCYQVTFNCSFDPEGAAGCGHLY